MGERGVEVEDHGIGDVGCLEVKGRYQSKG